MTHSLQSAVQALRDALAARDRIGVNAAAQRLIELDAPLGQQWGAVAQALQHNGEHRAAIAALNRWEQQAEQSPEIAFAQATVLARAGRLVQSLAKLDLVPTNEANAAAIAYTRGTLALNLGDIEQARTELFRSATLNPRSGQAWLALSMAGKLSSGESKALQAAAPPFAGASDLEAGAFHYALSRHLEDQGQVEAAFEAVANGAEIMRKLRPFDASQDDDRVGQLLASWSRDEISGISDRMGIGEGPAPILVTGLPRSGTTLVEQILASHSKIEGGGELGIVGWVEQALGDISPQALKLATPARLREGRSLYQHLAKERFSGEGLIVDKTVTTSRSLGLMAGLFPDAPIIWLRRDPADCAWSVYRTFFLRSVDWSWSLADIASFFRNEERLFEHWTRELADRILVVPYEELVTDSKGWIERITRFAGLSPEPAQQQPHLSARAVITASVAQVREPMDQRGIGVSAPHAGRMGAFFERYSADD